MRAGFATFITAFAPIETLLIEISINDFLTSTDPTQFATDYAFVLDQVRSLWPAAQVLCCGGMSSSELWLTGPPRLSSGTSTSVYDAAISTLCAARPGWTEYCSMADGMLAYEMINNAPSPGVSSGILTNDGIHPNLAGQVWMTQRYVTHFTFSP
jgi:hypothetical protein